MLKLRCKKTGEEVRSFSVLVNDLEFKRDFINVREGTIVEFNREYFSGKITQIMYGVFIKNIYKEFTYKVKKNEREYDFIRSLLNENLRFDVTPEMIVDSQEYGPFLVEFYPTPATMTCI